MKSLKLRSIVILSMMLIIFGIGSFHEAEGQVLCPVALFADGALVVDVSSPGEGADFIAGLLGTNEPVTLFGSVVGGIDWMYNNDSSLNTTDIGAQLIAWWSQRRGRNTFLHVTNISQDVLNVHVQIFDGNCVELRDFCDSYTGFDAHVYNLGDLVDNTGTPRESDLALQGREGFVVITPVVDCEDLRAIAFPFLTGDLRIIDTRRNYDYGTKMWSRDTDTLTDCTETVPVGNSQILDGMGDCRFLPVIPDELSHVFSTVGVPSIIGARSDVVFMTFSDNYSTSSGFGSGYSPNPASLTLFPTTIFDTDEHAFSCPPRTTSCLARFGINSLILRSDLLSIRIPLPPILIPIPPIFLPPFG